MLKITCNVNVTHFPHDSTDKTRSLVLVNFNPHSVCTQPPHGPFNSSTEKSNLPCLP